MKDRLAFDLNTQANQVAKIGNSVVPIMAKLLVQANCCNGEEATQNENC